MAASKNPDLCTVLVLTAWLQRKEVGGGENDAVFPHGHKTSLPTSKSTYSTTLDCLQKNSGLPRLTPHSFRSGHVCISIGNGSDPLTAMEARNWAQATSFQRYMELHEEGKMRSSKALGLQLVRATTVAKLEHRVFTFL